MGSPFLQDDFKISALSFVLFTPGFQVAAGVQTTGDGVGKMLHLLTLHGHVSSH